MSKEDKVFAGYKIKSLRVANGLKPEETAVNLDITKTYLSLIENGRKTPSKKVISKAAILFDVEEKCFYEPPELLSSLKELVDKHSLDEAIFALQSIISSNRNN